MGMALSEGRWWVWFDGEWLGFFDAAEGPVPGGSAQWFGEVFSPGPIARGEMGNGKPGTEGDAARIAGMCQVLAGTWTCTPSASLFPVVSEPGRYPVRLNGDELRYGGTR